MPPDSPDTGGESRKSPAKQIVNIKFGPAMNPDAARSQLHRLASNLDTPFRVDLSRCVRFDSVALLRLLAVIAVRGEHGLETRFRLPGNAAARQFLRRRGFDKAVERVLDVPFRALVDGKWFSNQDAASAELKAFENANSAIQAYLDSRNFFDFFCYDVSGKRDRVLLIEQEWLRWRNPLITQVLRDRLSEQHAHDVSRVVIQEMFTSLLGFVSGGDVVCVTQMDEAGSYPSAGFLTIAAWHAPYRAGGALFDLLMATIAEPSRAKEFNIAFVKARPPRSRSELWSDFVGKHRKGGHIKAEDVEDETSDVAVGKSQTEGFEALYRFVVDEFSGSIDFWSGTRFAQVSKNLHGESHYRVEVSDKDLVRDTGTIIAVRLPLSR
ncbi:hypothetical protein AB0368_15875 [Actinoplanes sp. NPDC051475]|uniref:hypothetical protein n=1 Tax=Actinoplanes sp. NPDC051475 TaxID=3157225 RepID=UPI00344CA2D2